MNSITSDKKTGVLLLGVLIVALFAAFYYYMIYPLHGEKQQKETSVSSLNAELIALDEQIAALEAEAIPGDNLFSLRKKVPENRDLNKLISSIQEVEFVSDAQITEITFNNYDEAVANTDLGIPETVVESESTDEQSDAEVEETPVSPVATAPLPEQLKLLTFNVDVKTKDFEALQYFLREVEGLERIIRIDAVDFSLPGEEQEFAIEPTESVGATVQLTTFFYSGE